MKILKAFFIKISFFTCSLKLKPLFNLLVPKDKVIYHVNELFSCAEEFNYPLVVKGKFYDAVVAYTLEQAQKAFYKLSGRKDSKNSQNKTSKPDEKSKKVDLKWNDVAKLTRDYPLLKLKFISGSLNISETKFPINFNFIILY